MDIKHGIKIIGTGSYTPETVVKNSDFSEYMDTDDEWIYSRTGIKERRFNTGKTNFFMAGEAAKRALDSAGAKPEEIDMIIVSTASPDFFYPSAACLVQNIIGAKNAAALDVSAACAGFIYALDVARNYLFAGKYKKIMVIASEFLSRQFDFYDRTVSVLFGDGAGCVIIGGSRRPYASVLGAAGEGCSDMKLFCKANYGMNVPFAKTADKEEQDPYIRMNGKDVYKFAVDIMPKAVKEVCPQAGFALSDVDLLIPHQANIRIINSAMKDLGIPAEKVFLNIEKRGNISSACIPVCLDELNRAGKLRDGARICAVAFGAGFTYGAAAFEL
ncbi:MAG: ketoacyl-ACP synthase III [Oscillospiraceae bacterium]|jgi:3-oxoacyl-[acyl-carrier-protein] synthase-3|nr:ketoacyl-ACP synthase III [Oscillospiraceae bacterium]